MLHVFQPCPFLVTFMYKTSQLFSLRAGTFRLFTVLGICCYNTFSFWLWSFCQRLWPSCTTVLSEEILFWACAPLQGPSIVTFVQHRHVVSYFGNKCAIFRFFIFLHLSSVMLNFDYIFISILYIIFYRFKRQGYERLIWTIDLYMRHLPYSKLITDFTSLLP